MNALTTSHVYCSTHARHRALSIQHAMHNNGGMPWHRNRSDSPILHHYIRI